MKRIVETLLEEGIDESVIHRILDLIEEEYEVVDENLTDVTYKRLTDTSNKSKEACDNCDQIRKKYGNDSEEAKKAWDEVAKIGAEENKRRNQFYKAVEMRDDYKTHRHNPYGKPKSERNQKQADNNKFYDLKDGQHGQDIQDIRQYQDAANGYPIARRKAEHRHAKKLKKMNK